MDVFNLDADQATEHITTAWDVDHDKHMGAWNAQRWAEKQEADLLHKDQLAREAEEWLAAKAEAEKEHKEAEKKKPKISDFNKALPPPSAIVAHPS